MFIKTSTFVAAGILTLAGTPVAMHLLSGSKGETVSWVKALHGGGPGSHNAAVAQHGSGGGAVISEASVITTPQSASDLSGKWTVTVQSEQGGFDSLMVIKQNGKKITGTFAGPHESGELPLTGEFSDGTVTLEVDGKTDHGDMRLAFKGAVKKDDGSLTGTMTSAMGEAKWTAKRTKS